MDAEVKQVKPVKNYILVEVLKKENKTQSGIIAGTNENIYIPYCRTIALGSMVNEVKEGKVYLYNQHAGTKVTFKDNPYLFIKEDDIYAEIEE
jgi:co-chaperonin GroES (HSP10)